MAEGLSYQDQMRKRLADQQNQNRANVIGGTTAMDEQQNYELSGAVSQKTMNLMLVMQNCRDI